MSDPLRAEWNRALDQGDDAGIVSLIDFDLMNEIFENFLATVGLPVAIIDLRGKVLASSRWQRVCIDFHRAAAGTRARCLESDTDLSRQMREGHAYAIYRCRNGLTDCATHIVVEGVHVANLFIGQFFLAPPDHAYFSRQQREFGFDEAAYFAAIAEVPIVAEARIPALLRLMGGLAEQIARQSLAQKRAAGQFAAIERTVAERTRQLAESHDRLRRITTRVPGIVFQFRRDREGGYAMPFASDATRDFFGVEPEALRDDAAKAFEAVHPDDLPDLLASIERSAAGLDLWHQEFRLASPAGIRWVLGDAVPQVEADGSILWHGFITDVSERRRSEDLLRISEERFRRLFEYSPVAYQSLDADGRMIDANQPLCDLLGLPREALLGRFFVEFWPHAARARFDDAYAGFVADGSVSGEVELLRGDGSVVTVMMEGRVERDLAGHFVRTHCVLYNISERKALERRLERSNADLEQFAYAASHDLRQPLHMISSDLTLIQRSLGRVEGDLAEWLGYAVDGAKRMDAMITGLLEFSRVGRKGHEPEPVRLDEMVDDALANLAVAIEESGAVVTIARGLPVVRGERMELIRLFQNLIGNAIKYVPKGVAPRVAIGCDESAGHWLISVADNGIGIPPEHREQVFGVFQRLVTQAQYEGTGIGLALCRKIVEHHGGRIWVDAAEPCGSVFRMELPKQG
ncbi:MAG: PocR ligand-binding domain-containing protein [Alphaproteobacteria bacterium]|nr:PocR ligand-binding domain-containing protein [Alphaproteobacteria bacterium]